MTLIELTPENYVLAGLIVLRWLPIAVLGFSCCLCGLELLLQQCAVAKRHAGSVVVATLIVMSLVEVGTWWHFVYMPCSQTFETALVLLTIAVSSLLYALMVRLLTAAIRKHSPKNHQQE